MSEEDIASAALLEFLNACEAGITAAKRVIKSNKNILEEGSWDPARIQWKPAEGNKGPYESSEDLDNPDFKLLNKQLAEHHGKLSRDGYFYWLFTNGSKIGRKQKQGSGHC
jgi:hypothetical protein